MNGRMLNATLRVVEVTILGTVFGEQRQFAVLMRCYGSRACRGVVTGLTSVSLQDVHGACI